jgi:thioredoxin 1
MDSDSLEIEVKEANFKSEVLDSKIPCLVDFWAEWCAPCKMLGPTLKTIAKEYTGKLKVCKINVDHSPGLASKYGIMSIPALFIFKDAKIQDSIVGAISKNQIASMLKPHMK